MTASSEQLIYEVNLDIDPAITGDYDLWLEDHVREMLGLPGFLSAEILHIEPDTDDEGAWQRRSVRYVVASREALEDYLREDAPRMRADGEERFGDRFKASRRILEEKGRLAPAGGELIECPNCDTPLNGQYCWHCGQRSRVRLITLRELLRDALGDLFELDSRLWRSVFPLLFRPGKLTHDYLEGRRARYMPPFRMYLVISILFFLVWSMTTGGFNITQEIDNIDTAGAEIAAEIRDDETLDAVSGASPYIEDDGTTDAAAGDTDEPSLTVEDTAGEDATNDDENCESIEFDAGPFDRWLTRERAVSICENVVRDSGASFLRALFDNLPAMMFLFLPLFALALKVLYLGSGRYYVEHLLFTVHYHAFFFLIVTVTVLIHTFQYAMHLPDWLVGIFTAVVVLYIQPVYLYKALRRVYHQGHVVTTLKWFVLSIAYLLSLTLTVLIGALVTAWNLD